jgi:short subunit dehydrogenase-like uncharacterized protein
MSEAPRRADREFDIIVYGATGFTGRLVARYLAEHAPSDLRIALAGRSASRLATVREGIPGTSHWALVTADSGNEASLATMAGMTRVLVTTVGPYLRYGLPVVQACATAGTHYVDLTGETLFIRRSIDTVDATARRTGARIVHSCGFDSVPSDLGVLALHLAALRDGGDGSLGITKLAVVSASGGVSGGTAGSALNQFAEAAADPSLARIVADPYALSPDRAAEPSPGDGGDPRLAVFDNDWKAWVSPFAMALINTRVVRRSNALLGYAYSKDFRYQEVMSHGAGPVGLLRAVAVASGTALGQAALSFGPTRSAAERVAPKSGVGPSEETMRNGRFALRLLSRTPDGTRYRGLVAAQGDPGYLATSLMISECALALAVDEARLPDRAGVLTPASGLGPAAIDRLIAAGMSITAHRG